VCDSSIAEVTYDAEDEIFWHSAISIVMVGKQLLSPIGQALRTNMRNFEIKQNRWSLSSKSIM
jgi:hypothetical protein